VATSGAGCDKAPPDVPSNGDLRLEPIERTTPSTLCDDVHYGFVQIYNNGQWGYICSNGEYTTARVVCRQLGFLYGSALTLIEEPNPDGYQFAPSSAPQLVWLNGVRCTGKEANLLDCFLGQNAFGSNSGAESPAGAPGPESAPPTPSPDSDPCQRDKMAIVCRTIEIKGALCYLLASVIVGPKSLTRLALVVRSIVTSSVLLWKRYQLLRAVFCARLSRCRRCWAIFKPFCIVQSRVCSIYRY
jgi:hypothetical protein